MAFRKGQSGNPGGRPHRAKIFTQALITALKRTDPEDVEVIQRIADKLVALAEGGDLHAIKEIADRVDGKVPQAIVGDDDHPAMENEITLIKRVIIDVANTSDPPARNDTATTSRELEPAG